MKTILNVNNGLDKINLKWNGFLSFLSYESPLTIHWHDCMGSVGKLFAILPYNENYRKAITKFSNNQLNGGNLISQKELGQILKLAELFENGQYEISYEQEYKYEINESWGWDLAKNERLHSSNLVLFEEKSKIKSDDLPTLRYLTDSFYDGFGETFVFTQPTESIELCRVKHYESIIKQGLKPTAIVYSGMFEDSGIYDDGSKWKSKAETGIFILDGHHKLLAYQNLMKAPSLLRICKRYQSKSDFDLNQEEFDNELRKYLFKSQIKHIISHCELQDET